MGQKLEKCQRQKKHIAPYTKGGSYLKATRAIDKLIVVCLLLLFWGDAFTAFDFTCKFCLDM